VAGDSPKIHGGVGAPRSAGLDALFQFPRSGQSQGTEKAEIAGGKGVRLAEGAHGNVLCGPFADAGDFAQAVEKCVGVDDSREVDLAGANGAGQIANGFGTGAGDADRGEFGLGENLSGWKQVREAGGPFERFPVRAGNAAREGGRALDGNLLAENGAGGEFEAIPATGNAKAGIELYSGCQSGIGS